MKTLPRIVDDRVSLVLTPQAYHNYDPATDIFNHSAYAYWSMMVPGEDAWGHIVCTGGTLPLPFAFALCLCPLPFKTLPSDCLSALPLAFSVRDTTLVGATLCALVGLCLCPLPFVL